MAFDVRPTDGLQALQATFILIVAIATAASVLHGRGPLPALSIGVYAGVVTVVLVVGLYIFYLGLRGLSATEL